MSSGSSPPRKLSKNSSPLDESLLRHLATIEYVDEDEEEYEMGDCSILDSDRKNMYAKLCNTGSYEEVVAVTCKSGEGTVREFLVGFTSVSELQSEIVWGECGITCAQVCPSELVEYKFEDGVWHQTPATKEALTMYRDTKFKQWHERLLSPSCEVSSRI